MDVSGARLTVQARFAGADPELPNGFAEHAPMGVDALLALGLDPDAVVAWAARHDPVPLAPASPVAVHRAKIVGELERLAWDEVLRHHTAGLAGRLDARLFHGLIRTAHAVRGLRPGADPAGLGELATALAAWHVWAESDGGPGERASGRPAIVDVPGVVVDAARRGAGACATRPSIVTIHAVTAPMAFLLLADLLDDATVAAAAGAFARTHARYGPPPQSPPDGATRPGPDRLASLLDRWDAHPAKLTEAALRGFDATGDAVFLAAIEAVTGP